MTLASRAHSLYKPAETASVMRQLAETPDRRSFFVALREALPDLLPAIRIDILTNEPYDGDYLLLTSATEASTPLPATHTLATFAEWLSCQGYGTVLTLPLSSADQQLGWMLLAQRHGLVKPNAIALAGQLAALIALRLSYEQYRDDLAERDTYNAVLEQRLREVDSMRQRATMAAGAAHDIRNLLAVIRGYADLMMQSSPPALHPDLQAIRQAANDGQQLIRRLLSMHMPNPSITPPPLSLLPTVIRDAIKLTQPFWEPHTDITVKTTLAPVPPVRGNAAELREVLINLIMNALTAMPEGGTLTVRSFVVGQHVLVAVDDTGEGIAHEHQNTIFQPYVTMRKDGTGLGLSISRAIIESYGGTLTVASAPGEGATFTVALPAIRSLDAIYEAQPTLCAPYATI